MSVRLWHERQLFLCVTKLFDQRAPIRLKQRNADKGCHFEKDPDFTFEVAFFRLGHRFGQ